LKALQYFFLGLLYIWWKSLCSIHPSLNVGAWRILIRALRGVHHHNVLLVFANLADRSQALARAHIRIVAIVFAFKAENSSVLIVVDYIFS
jgi:hypothetical protein